MPVTAINAREDKIMVIHTKITRRVVEFILLVQCFIVLRNSTTIVYDVKGELCLMYHDIRLYLLEETTYLLCAPLILSRKNSFRL